MKKQNEEKVMEQPPIINENGMIDCRDCLGCIHKGAYRRNPRAYGGLDLCPRLSNY